MKDKIFGVLQRIGRSFMLPIAILPVAGLLLGIGSSLTNATTIETYNLTGILGEGTILNALFTIMTKAGNAIFDNLPIIFAVGVAIGMAKKEKEVAALSAMIAFLVMNVTINALLQIDGTVLADGTISEDVLSGTVASVLGIQTLQMGVFGGIIVGLGVAALHNKYYKNHAAECAVLLRWLPVCTDYFHSGICWSRNSSVFCMAVCAEWNLRTGRTGDGNRIFRNI